MPQVKASKRLRRAPASARCAAGPGHGPRVQPADRVIMSPSIPRTRARRAARCRRSSRPARRSAWPSWSPSPRPPSSTTPRTRCQRVTASMTAGTAHRAAHRTRRPDLPPHQPLADGRQARGPAAHQAAGTPTLIPAGPWPRAQCRWMPRGMTATAATASGSRRRRCRRCPDVDQRGLNGLQREL